MKCDSLPGCTKSDYATTAEVLRFHLEANVANAVLIIVASLSTDEPLSEQEREVLWLAASFIESRVAEALRPLA